MQTIEKITSAKDEHEVTYLLKKVERYLERLDIELNFSQVLEIIDDINQGVRTVEYLYYEDNKIVSKLLTKESLLSKIAKIYLDISHKNSTLVVETFYSIGYLLSFNSKQAEKIYKILGDNPDTTKLYLYNGETSAMMLQLLLAFNKQNPDFWKGDDSLEELLSEFLFTGPTTASEIIAAFSPLDTHAYNNNLKYLHYILEFIGFSNEAILEILEAWESAYDCIDTIYESIIPNILSIIFLESELPGAAKTLKEVYGINSFARNSIEQFIEQYELYQKILQRTKNSDAFKQKTVISIQMDNDNSGSFLGHRDKLWKNARRILKEQNIQLIVAETGGSIENIVETLRTLENIHGSTEALILTSHASLKGLLLYYQFGDEPAWEIVDHKIIREFLTPALISLLSNDATLILDICEAIHYKQDFPGIDILHGKGQKNKLIDFIKSDKMPLEPVFYQYTEGIGRIE